MPRTLRQRLFHLLAPLPCAGSSTRGLKCPLDRFPVPSPRQSLRDLQIALRCSASVRQVRPPVLHSGNPRIRIMRVLPSTRIDPLPDALAITSLARIFPSHLASQSRRLSPAPSGNSSYPCLGDCPGAPMLRRRCIRFQRSGIVCRIVLRIRSRAARPDPLQYPVKDCFVSVATSMQSSGSGDRGVIRRLTSLTFTSQKLSQSQRIDWLIQAIRSFRSGDPFEIPHQSAA